MALAGDVEDLRGHARVPQACGVGGDVPAEPQRALLPDQRLTRARRPRVPGASRPHRVEDLPLRRVQVTEAARLTRRLPITRLGALEQHDVRATPHERCGHAEPENSSADDHDIGNAPHVAPTITAVRATAPRVARMSLRHPGTFDPGPNTGAPRPT